MLAAILKQKFFENHLGTERILCAENRVKIRHHLEGEAGRTDTDACYTPDRKSWPKSHYVRAD